MYGAVGTLIAKLSLMRLAVPLLLLAACADPIVVSLGSGEVSLPERLDFPPTALNFPRTQAVRVVNRSRVAHSLTVATAPPFSAPTSLEVPGGAEVSLEVVFTPTRLGTSTGTLFLDDVAVPITGEGVEATQCGASSPCDQVHFNPDSLSCVHTVKEEGASCGDELQCIEAGSCRSGLCVGQAARCDDRDACTTDSCAIGTGCQHSTAECAAPANPCLAPTCDPILGCGSSPVIDGTPCGAVSCALANICLAGTCRAVVPPEGFTCSPESACRGEGACHQQTCVIPAETDLSPRWSYQSSDGDFRFEGITDAQGNWYWVECGNPTKPTNPTYRCTAVSLTANGFERFRTDVIESTIWGGSYRHTQLLAGGLFIFVSDAANLVAIDAATGTLTWHGPLTSQATTQPNHITQLAEDGQGTLWVIADLTPNGGRPRSVLSRVLVSTGVVQGETVVDGQPAYLVLDSHGGALVERSWIAGPPLGSAFERYASDGTRTFSVPLTTDQGPSMVVGDRVVMLDDSVRSAVDGALIETRETGGWDPREWTGIAANSTGRFRLSRSMLDDVSTTIALDRVDNGARSQVFTVDAGEASQPQLTATGDALFVSVLGLWNANAETRVHQVHRLGREVMSCRLIDQPTTQPGWVMPLQNGGATGFNGRWLAVRTTMECPSCAFWGPPRLVFFDLGRNSSPGVSSSGWVGPLGTPAGSYRAR